MKNLNIYKNGRLSSDLHSGGYKVKDVLARSSHIMHGRLFFLLSVAPKLVSETNY